MQVKAFQHTVQRSPEGKDLGKHTTTEEQNLSGEKAKTQGASTAQTVRHEGAEVPPHQEQVPAIQERWVYAPNRRNSGSIPTPVPDPVT